MHSDNVKIFNDCAEGHQVLALEIKTSQMENQLTLLSSKFETLQFHLLANKCSPCVSKESSSEIHEVHTNLKHEPKHLCEVCEKQFKTKEELELHLSNEHIPKFKCNKCEYRAESKDDLKIHKQNVHKPKTYNCESCDFESIHLNQVEKHRRTEHQTIHSFGCDLCTYKAMCDNDLDRHKQTMHEGNHPCDKCEVKCKSKADFDKHVSFKHRSFNGERYFYSATRRNKSQDNKCETTTKREPTNLKASNNLPENEFENSSSQSSLPDRLGCHGPCSSLQKTFSCTEELELHKAYFHTGVDDQEQKNQL